MRNNITIKYLLKQNMTLIVFVDVETVQFPINILKCVLNRSNWLSEEIKKICKGRINRLCVLYFIPISLRKSNLLKKIRHSHIKFNFNYWVDCVMISLFRDPKLPHNLAKDKKLSPSKSVWSLTNYLFTAEKCHAPPLTLLCPR